jgi:hypothetical protein
MGKGGCRVVRRSAEERNAQNEPNLARPEGKCGSKARLGHRGKKSGGDARPTKSRIVQNEPNFAPPQVGDGGNCAKRSQTWGDWGVWERAVVARGVARPRSEMRKTNPISGPGAPRLPIGD